MVYGQPAIVAGIDRYVVVEASDLKGDEVDVYSEDISVKGVNARLGPGGAVYTCGEAIAEKAFSYVFEAIRQIRIISETVRGAAIRIKSDMPVGAGLGTSAAVAAGTCAAYSAILGLQLDPATLAELATKAELGVQGSSSGMDAHAVCLGGVNVVNKANERLTVSRLKIRGPLPLGVVETPREAPTAHAVETVARLRSRYPDLVDRLNSDIGAIVQDGVTTIESGNLTQLGELMNINHGLLSSLGVSTAAMEEAVYSARRAGAIGSKITGAGMGGSVVYLCDTDRKLGEVNSVLRNMGMVSSAVHTVEKGVSVTLV